MNNTPKNEHRLRQCREAQRRFCKRYPLRVKEQRDRFRFSHARECLEYDKQYQRKRRHVHSLLATWAHIKARCLKPTHSRYKDYGGRGITIFRPWIESFKQFEQDIVLAIGPRPVGLTLDRRDNDQGYYPGNLRWATYTEQNHNRRCSSKPL